MARRDDPHRFKSNKSRSNGSKPHRSKLNPSDPSRAVPGRSASSRPSLQTYALEHLPGLLEAARAELEGLGAAQVAPEPPETLRFAYGGSSAGLLELRRAVAVYRLLAFPVPRPKALLGDANLRRLLGAVQEVLALHPPGSFAGFRFAAAGADSSVFSRLAAALAAATGLRHDPADGELLLRVRPGPGGWDVLVRLGPRPLSARAWRVCNRSGGLNATLAVVMNDWVMNDWVSTDSRAAGGHFNAAYLNAMCGSGTLLVEQALSGPVLSDPATSGPTARLVGFDLDPAALECARANLGAAGVLERVTLIAADAGSLPFADGSFGAIACDLPWGDAVGSHADNALLYPAFLKEAARVGTPDARMVLLTHELKLFARVLGGQSRWRVLSEQRVFHGGHYPRVFVLGRA